MFAIFLGWLMAIVASLWNLLQGGAWYNVMPDEFQQFAGSWAAGSAFGFVVNVIVAPIVVVIGVFIMSVVLHVSGVLVGATKASDAGFEGSLRVVSYTMVAQLGQLVPVVGGLIALVWGIVLAVLGVSSLHRTTEGKASAAVLLPLILCCVCLALFALFGAALVGASLFNAFGS